LCFKNPDVVGGAAPVRDAHSLAEALVATAPQDSVVFVVVFKVSARGGGLLVWRAAVVAPVHLRRAEWRAAFSEAPPEIGLGEYDFGEVADIIEPGGEAEVLGARSPWFWHGPGQWEAQIGSLAALKAALGPTLDA
jgi:hypothetical protein